MTNLLIVNRLELSFPWTPRMLMMPTDMITAGPFSVSLSAGEIQENSPYCHSSTATS
jgi:hypothetical protein